MDLKGGVDHPVVKQMDQQWHQVMAVAMHKLNIRDIEITQADIESLPADSAVIADARGGKFFIRLRTLAEMAEFEQGDVYGG